MRLTLKSLQTEMRSSFDEMSLRVDKLDTNLKEIIDNLSLKLDGHIEECTYNFRNIDERFKGIDKRFDKLPGEILGALLPYFNNIVKMLSNHEDRISALERRH